MKLLLLGLGTLVVGSVVVAVASPRDAAWVLVALALGMSALLARAMLSARSGLLEETVWRSPDPSDRRVAIAFEGGPDPNWSPIVLDALERSSVSATFFVGKEGAREHPELVRRMADAGHDVACHMDARTHRASWFRRGPVRAEIESCVDVVRSAVGRTPRLFRPAFGARSPFHAGAANAAGLALIGSAKRAVVPFERTVATRHATQAVGTVRGGEILTLGVAWRPMGPNSDTELVDALARIVDGLVARGFEVVPVSTLLAIPAYRESRRAWTGRSRGGRSGIGFFAAVVRCAGPRVAELFLHPVAAWFVVASPTGRRASIELRTRLHGQGTALSEWIWAYRHFVAFARNLLARLAARVDDGRSDVVHHLDGPVEEALGAPGGVLFVSAHLGDWTAASRRIRFGDRRLAVVAFEGAALGVHQMRRDIGAAPFDVIDASAPPATVAMEVLARLQEGNAVAMLGDRVLHGEGVPTPFLGGTVRLPPGPWTTAMLARVPAFLFVAVREPGGRLHLHVRGPLRVEPADRTQRASAISQATREFAEFLECCVRRYPLQWANFYPFWEPE